ncbi:sigma-70 family RNA polymerase sigma factor [Oscillatoria laete-virens NRMC-F 0139]|nr:sigma-70 family RNA polymerase sigma factor [Oscillatoria laete-virens]MDL5055367.1 sigma-70 family RNA polymerase sigma factor [Oscillatoria laete-virens NRMC-F 0139]
MPQELDHDTQLMVQVSRGDLRAFEELVTKHKSAVVNTVYKMIGDINEAEDVAQNVFIQIYKAAPRYQPSAKFTTWMFTIVRNLSLNEIRRRGTHKLDSLEGSQAPDDSDRPDPQFADQKSKTSMQVAEQNELERAIDEALGSLPENQRTALILRRYEDMPYEEIAKVINCSVAATKSIIFRARETMKEKLAEYLRP